MPELLPALFEVLVATGPLRIEFSTSVAVFVLVALWLWRRSG